MTVANLFSRLIEPMEPRTFFEERWEKKFFYVQRGQKDAFTDYPVLEDIERYFQSKTLHPSFLRLVKSGTDCPEDEWTDIEKRRNTGLYRVVNNEKVLSLMAAGATIIINAAERAMPTVGTLCSELEKELGIRIQANVYITPPGEKGFEAHFDPHDVFVLQVAGKKQWRLFGAGKDLADTKLKDPEHEIEMLNGDFLYLPSKVVHEAHTTSEMSIHITMGLHAMKWFQLVQRFAAMAEKSIEFERSVPLRFSSDEERGRFASDFSSSMSRLIEATDICDLLDSERSAVTCGSAIETGRQFTGMLLSSQLNLDSIVGINKDANLTVTEDPKKITVKSNASEISFSAVLRQTVKYALSKESFAIRELAGLVSDSGKVELAKTLVRAGFILIHDVNGNA